MKQILCLLFVLMIVIPFTLVAQTTRDFNYYMKMGNSLLMNRKAKEALPMLDSALLLNPKSPDAYSLRGKVKSMEFSMMEGMKDYDTAILYADKKDKLKYYELKEERVSGKVTFSFLSSSSPKKRLPSGSFENPRTNLKGENGKLPPDYVLNIFNQAINMFPNTAKSYMDRANFYLMGGMISEAISDANKAIKIEHSPESYLNLCGIMRMSSSSIMLTMDNTKAEKSKKYTNEDILKVFNESVRYNPNNAKSYEDRAAFYECLFLLDKAKEDYDMAIALKPSFTNLFRLANLKWKSNENDSNKYSNTEILFDFKSALNLSSSAEPFFGIDFDMSSNTSIPNKRNYLYKKRAGYYSSIKQYDNAIKDMDSAMELVKPNIKDFETRADYKDLSGKYSPDDIMMELNNAKSIMDANGNEYTDRLYDRLYAKYNYLSTNKKEK